MAPPPPAAGAAAAADAEPLEVRCAGCGETLEVDQGLTEFICPDCATPQSLPPELMPPPPPRRKALPLPRGAADVRGARLPCGVCGALLSVPVGLSRCACPLCGAELAVDTARLRHYLLSSAAAADAVPVVPLGASSSAPPILQPREVWCRCCVLLGSGLSGAILFYLSYLFASMVVKSFMFAKLRSLKLYSLGWITCRRVFDGRNRVSLCVVGVPLFLREVYNLTKLTYHTSRLRGVVQ